MATENGQPPTPRPRVPNIPTATPPPGTTVANPIRTGPVGWQPGAPVPPPPSLEQRLEQELEGLPGQERDAYAALKTLFDSYGLGSLAPKILQYLQNGFGADTITVLLQQTPEYKQRFAGNQ